MDRRDIPARNGLKSHTHPAGTCNETLIKARGWNYPLGKRIQIAQFNGKVIGVVKDFYFKPVHTPVEPLAIWQFNGKENYRGLFHEQYDLIQRFLIAHIKKTARKNPSRTLHYE